MSLDLFTNSLEIITPNFNYGRYLNDCISSVREQQGYAVSISHTVVDGKSTDESHEILSINASADTTLKWLNYIDKNQADAMNFALHNSKSKWVGWLNSDEFYLDGALSRVLDIINEQPEIDAIYGDSIFCDEDKRFIRLKGAHRYSNSVLQNYGAYISTCSFFIKRDLLEQIGSPYLDTNLRISLDWDLFIRLFSNTNRICYLPVPIGVYRVHESTLTNLRTLEDKQHEIDYIVRKNNFNRSKVLGKYHHRLLKMLDGSYRREIDSYLKYRDTII